ncbi:STAS domain-containing protein [Candidatus Poribacteria bacterium]|nr:STAS domain-containing protein [Candidatus Poribacteria bacterium]
MLINKENKDDGVVISLKGKIIGDSVIKFKQSIDEQIDAGAKWIILDLAQVPMMDSSALGTIIAAFLKLRERKGKLALLNAQKGVVNVLNITKLDTLFSVYDDMQSALESINS